MIKKTLLLLVTLAFLLFTNLSPLYGQQQQNLIGFGGGISKATGDGSEYWKLGFSINGEFFHKVTENILIGGRVAYNRLSADEDELKKEFSGISGLSLDVSGSASIIEFIPSIRLISSPSQGQNVQVFGQLGFGYYILKMEAEASATYMGNSESFSMDETDNDFGLNIGAGIIIKKSENIKFSIYPLYNFIFTEEETTKYFTINLGILFSI